MSVVSVELAASYAIIGPEPGRLPGAGLRSVEADAPGASPVDGDGPADDRGQRRAAVAAADELRWPLAAAWPAQCAA